MVRPRYNELQKRKFDQIMQKNKHFSRPAHSFLKVKLRHLRRKTLNVDWVKELYSLVLGLFNASAIIKTKKYQFVTPLFQPDKVVLLDSQRTSPLLLLLKDVLRFTQREVSANPDFAAVKLQAPELVIIQLWFMSSSEVIMKCPVPISSAD